MNENKRGTCLLNFPCVLKQRKYLGTLLNTKKSKIISMYNYVLKKVLYTWYTDEIVLCLILFYKRI